MEISLFFAVFVGILFVVLKKHHLPRFTNTPGYKLCVVLLCLAALTYRFKLGFLLSLFLFFTIVLHEIPDVSEFFQEEEEEEEEETNEVNTDNSLNCTDKQYYDIAENVCKEIQSPGDCRENEEYNGYICKPVDFSMMSQNQVDDEMMVVGPIPVAAPETLTEQSAPSNMYDCNSDEYFDPNDMKCVKRIVT